MDKGKVFYATDYTQPALGVIERNVRDGSKRSGGMVYIDLRWGNRDEQQTLDELSQLSHDYADVLAWPAQNSEFTDAQLERVAELDNEINRAGHQLNGSIPVVTLEAQTDAAQQVRVKLEFLQFVCHGHIEFRTWREALESEAIETYS